MTPGVVSGIECTRSPTANNADEKSTAGAGRAAAADNKKMKHKGALMNSIFK